MVNLFDIMRQAQNGNVYENMARQFGLSAADARRAGEALLPAFSLGLQRMSADPNAFANVLGLMSSGRYAPFYDRPFAGLWPQARASGNDVLGQLFGSPDAIGRVAGQASAMSGIGAQVLQQMMPAMASVLMGGLFRVSSVEGFSDFLRQWADWLSAAKLSSPPPRRSARPNGPDPFAPWSDMMTTLFGGAAATGTSMSAPKQVAASPASRNDVWTEMMKAWAGAQMPEPPPPPPPPPPPARPNPFESLSQMFQTGMDVQAQHLAGLQSVFDSLWGAGRTR